MHNARPGRPETPTHGRTERDLEKETLRPVLLLLLLRPIITVDTLVSAFLSDTGLSFNENTKEDKKRKKKKLYSENPTYTDVFK